MCGCVMIHELADQPSPCFLATLMPDGSPQMTQTWVGTDGEHVVINNCPGAPEGEEHRA